MERTSELAYERARDSGYIKNMQLLLFDAYCEYWDTLTPQERDKGITANEIIEFIKRTKHPAGKMVKKDRMSHLNKIQAPLRQKGFLKETKVRICKVQGTLAKADVLTFKCGHKLKKQPSRQELKDYILYLETSLNENNIKFNRWIDVTK